MRQTVRESEREGRVTLGEWGGVTVRESEREGRVTLGEWGGSETDS